MHPTRSAVLSLSVLALSGLLAGCGEKGEAHAPAPTARSSESVLTVLQPGTATDAQLEAKYGGVLITRTPGFALLGVGGSGGTLGAQGRNTRLEKNTGVFRVSPGQAKSGSTLSASGTVGIWGNGTVGIWGNGTVGIWGNGTVGIWGNGTVGIWGNGTVGIWGNGQYQPIPQNTDTWQQIGLEEVQSSGRASGQGTTIAIVDTGIDLDHPAYQGHLSDASTWHDFVDGDSVPQDDGELGTGLTGHGTEVAGIAAQVAPGAQIMPLRVLNSDGSGDVSSVTAAIVWAVDHGADVINLSLGTDAPVTAITQAIAYANSQGVAVAGAVGNSGAEGLDYPAAQFHSMPMNLAVGSASASDSKSAFSRYGAGLELLAPGEGVFGPAPQNRVAAWSGTSMSAPMVASALALGMGLGATAEQAAAALTGAADAVDSVSGNEAYAGKLGSGRLNLDAALTQLGH